MFVGLILFFKTSIILLEGVLGEIVPVVVQADLGSQ